MGELIHLGHAQRMLVRSGGERGIPFEQRKILRSTIFVGGIQQGLVGDAGLRTRDKKGRDKKKREKDQERTGTMSTRHRKLLLLLNTKCLEKV
jgi:hypothetical protein